MNHLTLLIIASALFAIVQIITFRKSLRWLALFVEQTKDILENPSKNYSANLLPSWLAPFVKTANNSSHITQAREIALRQLEEHVYSQASYQLLQKATIAAPLLGVLLTAFGFIMFDGQLNQVKDMALPLVSGVATGALLALFNLSLLHIVEQRMESARKRGQGLIDDYWVARVNRQEDPNRNMLVVAKEFNKTVERLADLVGEFPQDVSEMTARFDALSRVAQSTFSTLSSIAPDLESSVRFWNKAAGDLSEVTTSDLLPTFESLKTGAGYLEKTGKQIELLATDLNHASKRINETSTDQETLLTSLIESARDLIDENDERFTKQVEKIETTQKKWFENLNVAWDENFKLHGTRIENYLADIRIGTESIATPLRETATNLTSAVPGLKNTGHILDLITRASVDFSDVISNQLTPAHQHIEKFERLADKMTDTVNRLAKSLIGIEKIGSSGIALTELIQNRAMPTAEVLQRATGSFEDSANEISECTRELSDAILLFRNELVKSKKR